MRSISRLPGAFAGAIFTLARRGLLFAVFSVLGAALLVILDIVLLRERGQPER